MSRYPLRDELDDKVNRVFAGKVVRKDLVRKVKVGANVPVFVLEFLLGKYCASSDEMAIQMGLQVVNDTLANNYIRPDESMKAQSQVKEQGRHTFIDKVKVRLVDSGYWAEVTNFGHKFVHIPDRYVRDYERLLTGGVWAQIDMRFEYDEEEKGKNPFWIDKLTPIQIATFDLDEYRRLRTEFTTDEWLDLMIRSMGYEPTQMDRRLKLLFLVRLIPLCERNFNLVELGPRGTGKSYVVQEVSPYAALLTGPTTVANLFGHMSGRQKGMVQIWDVVGFDEVADLQKMPKEVITTMKTYCESGTSSAARRRRPATPASRCSATPTSRSTSWSRPATCSRRCRTSSATTWRSSTDSTSTCPAGKSRRCGTSSSPTTTASSSTTSPRRCASCASTTSPRSSTATSRSART